MKYTHMKITIGILAVSILTSVAGQANEIHTRFVPGSDNPAAKGYDISIDHEINAPVLYPVIKTFLGHNRQIMHGKALNVN